MGSVNGSEHAHKANLCYPFSMADESHAQYQNVPGTAASLPAGGFRSLAEIDPLKPETNEYDEHSGRWSWRRHRNVDG